MKLDYGQNYIQEMIYGKEMKKIISYFIIFNKKLEINKNSFYLIKPKETKIELINSMKLNIGYCLTRINDFPNSNEIKESLYNEINILKNINEIEYIWKMELYGINLL